jgi:hypothetical protein
MFLGIYRLMKDIQYHYEYLSDGADAERQRKKFISKFKPCKQDKGKEITAFKTEAYTDVKKQHFTIHILGGSDEFKCCDSDIFGIDIVCMDVPMTVSVRDICVYNFYMDLYNKFNKAYLQTERKDI